MMVLRLASFFTIVVLGGSLIYAAEAGATTMTVSARSTACQRILQAHEYLENVDIGEAIVATLKELLTKTVITSPDLNLIIQGHNPIASQNTPTAIEFREVIDQIIKAIQSNPIQLEPIVQNLIDDESLIFNERTIKEVQTKSRFTTPRFYPIETGSFMMGSPEYEYGHQVNEGFHLVKIDRKFWIANYPVTQWQYAMVMGKNLSYFRIGEGSIELEIKIELDGQTVKEKIRMRPNNPVEMVSAIDENIFISKLNKLSKNDDPLIYEILPDHKKHWQYRRPSEEEWEYVARNRGVWHGAYPKGITRDNLTRIGWYENNSEGSTHPVGELEAILIDGKYPIYDMHGNVWERTLNGDVTRGGGYCNGRWDLRAAYRCSVSPEAKGEMIGFRLVRTPP